MLKPRRRLPLLVLFFIAWPAAPARAQKISYHRVEQSAVEERLKGSPSDNLGRQKKLHELFEAAGCKGEALSEVEVEGSALPNVICKLPGESNSVIIVGAHYDKVTAGQGVVDNWSGAALLASLFESLKDEPRRHTFLFIGFTDEEKGLVGSAQFLEQTTAEQRSRIRAMVNLDSLGLSPTKVWLSHADKGLAAGLNNVAASMKLPLAGVNVEQVASADSESFAKRRIPSLTIHSVTQETYPILHSSQDTLAAIHMDDYYDTYRLAAAYLSYLDQKLAAGKEEAPAAQK
ncbi:MAG: M28 family metallopeptidase [Acidobacteriota bacterium]|nr:M28 family metallopeptidase [Acidobacteriota bacterium]